MTNQVNETPGAPAQERADAQPAAAGTGTAPATEQQPRRGSEALYFALRNRKLIVGLSIVGVFVLLAIFGPMINSTDPRDYVGPKAAPPSAEYWFGTTTFGQDIFAQFVNGLRATFMVGLLGGGLGALVGMVIGFAAGYRGGLVDEVLNTITNIVIVLPTLAVLIIIASYLGVRSLGAQALFIGFTSWTWAARAVRAQTFSLRSRDFVDLARLSGVSSWKIILREIAANMSSYLLMSCILLFGNAVLIAASLDFIGLGPTEGFSLGLMINHSMNWSAMQLGLWWWFIPPGVAITAIVGSLYVMNVGLDEVFNPKLREM